MKLERGYRSPASGSTGTSATLSGQPSRWLNLFSSIFVLVPLALVFISSESHFLKHGAPTSFGYPSQSGDWWESGIGGGAQRSHEALVGFGVVFVLYM